MGDAQQEWEEEQEAGGGAVVVVVRRCSATCASSRRSSIKRSTLFVDAPGGGGAALQASLSQKHMWPPPPDSYMHTWSTRNMLICSRSVHVRRTSWSCFPCRLTILTQHPWHSRSVGRFSSLWLNGSRQRGSCSELQS